MAKRGPKRLTACDFVISSEERELSARLTQETEARLAEERYQEDKKRYESDPKYREFIHQFMGLFGKEQDVDEYLRRLSQVHFYSVGPGRIAGKGTNEEKEEAE